MIRKHFSLSNFYPYESKAYLNINKNRSIGFQLAKNIFYFEFLHIFCYFTLFLFYFNIFQSTPRFSSISIERTKIQNFIKSKKPLNPHVFKYFLEKDYFDLLSNYKKLTPNNDPTEYQKLVPFHGNGIPKKNVNYRDLLSINNVNIKHFTFYLNHKDKHEYENKSFLLQSKNGPTIIPLNYKTNFTLIYGISVGKTTPFIIREIKAISNDEVAIIIFYDNKANRTLLYNLFSNETDNKQFKNVYFIDSPRFYVGWGMVTQAFTEIVMMQAALKFFPNSLYISFHRESYQMIA